MPIVDRDLSLADGQLGTTAATLAGSSAAAVPSGALTAIFANILSIDVTVTVTFKRSGGTARRLCKVVLSKDEELRIVNLAIQPDDSFVAVADVASAIDYVVYGSRGGSMEVSVNSADGSIKQKSSGSLAVSGSLFSLDQLVLDELQQMNSLLRRICVGVEMIASGDPIADPETP